MIKIWLWVFAFALLGYGTETGGVSWLGVGATSKYLFAFDEDGNIRWKTQIEGPAGYSPSAETLILKMPKTIRAYERQDGEVLWEIKFDKEIRNYRDIRVMRPPLHYLKVNLKDDPSYIVIDGTTGSILRTEPFNFFKNILKRWLYKPRFDPAIGNLTRKLWEINYPTEMQFRVETTPKWIVAFDSNATLLWRVELPEWLKKLDGSPSIYIEDSTVALISNDDAIGFNLRTGELLYQKKLPELQQPFVEDYNTGSGWVRKFKDYHWYRFSPKAGAVVLIQ